MLMGKSYSSACVLVDGVIVRVQVPLNLGNYAGVGGGARYAAAFENSRRRRWSAGIEAGLRGSLLCIAFYKTHLNL